MLLFFITENALKMRKIAFLNNLKLEKIEQVIFTVKIAERNHLCTKSINFIRIFEISILLQLYVEFLILQGMILSRFGKGIMLFLTNFWQK